MAPKASASAALAVGGAGASSVSGGEGKPTSHRGTAHEELNPPQCESARPCNSGWGLSSDSEDSRVRTPHQSGYETFRDGKVSSEIAFAAPCKLDVGFRFSPLREYTLDVNQRAQSTVHLRPPTNTIHSVCRLTEAASDETCPCLHN